MTTRKIPAEINYCSHKRGRRRRRRRGKIYYHIILDNNGSHASDVRASTTLPEGKLGRGGALYPQERVGGRTSRRCGRGEKTVCVPYTITLSTTRLLLRGRHEGRSTIAHRKKMPVSNCSDIFNDSNGGSKNVFPVVSPETLAHPAFVRGGGDGRREEIHVYVRKDRSHSPRDNHIRRRCGYPLLPRKTSAHSR